jgi:hypothetical protein
MQNLLRRLKAAWLFTRTVPYRDLYPGFWDNADAKWLSNMFNTVHGAKLKMILTNFVSETQMNACLPAVKEPNFNRGIAYGAQALIATIQSHMKLSEVPADSGTIEESQTTGAENFDHLHP